jgi:thiamine pyrophosphate-dependent acetolactate synthase large subunit-like protein
MAQVSTRWTAERLMEEVKKLTPEEFRRFWEQLSAWRAKQEQKFLRTIRENSQLPPKKQRRFNQLRRKLQNETKLLSLWQEVERRNVERLRALIELAKLRGVSVQELMRQLGIGENTDVF